jgi:hypothetical protein
MGEGRLLAVSSDTRRAAGQCGIRALALLAGLAFSLVSVAAPDEEALGKSRGYPKCPNAKGSFSPEWCLVGVMSHYHEIYPSRVVKKADSPRPLRRAAQELAVGLEAFVAEHRNTGLLVMQGDTIHAASWWALHCTRRRSNPWTTRRRSMCRT